VVVGQLDDLVALAQDGARVAHVRAVQLGLNAYVLVVDEDEVRRAAAQVRLDVLAQLDELLRLLEGLLERQPHVHVLRQVVAQDLVHVLAAGRRHVLPVVPVAVEHREDVPRLQKPLQRLVRVLVRLRVLVDVLPGLRLRRELYLEPHPLFRTHSEPFNLLRQLNLLLHYPQLLLQ